MGNVLLISENPKPLEDLCNILAKANYKIHIKKYDIFNSNKKSDMTFDFLFLDLKSSHDENLRYLTILDKNCTIPVYLFGTEVTEFEELAYYNAGAQGVIRVPFNAGLVAGRIKSVISILEKTCRIINRVKIAGLEFDLQNRTIIKPEGTIKLTNVEAKILRILLQHRDSVVDKDTIIHYVWNDNDSATDNALGIHIARLRNKIEYDESKPIIDTIWGTGYRLNSHH